MRVAAIDIGTNTVLLLVAEPTARGLVAVEEHAAITRLGEGVGYQIRLESRVSERTRIRFVTEGILLRQMSFDPSLPGVAAVVFDEFHERHLHGDISLARALQIQRTTRPALRIIVMSATLETARLEAYLAPAATLVSKGRSFPVRVEYQPRTVDRKSTRLNPVTSRSRMPSSA